MSEIQNTTDLSAWFAALSTFNAVLELGVLVLCAVLAWLVARLVRQAVNNTNAQSVTFGRRVVDGVLFPLLWLVLAWAAKDVLRLWLPIALFKIAIPTLMALLVIRSGVKVLQVTLGDTPLVHLMERTISWLAWIAMVLWVSGLLPAVLAELEDISWKVGGSTLTARTAIEGALTAGAVLIVTLWISSAIEARLLRNATGGELSVRKAVSNATRALLMFVGLLVALSSVGIDLTALSVLGGGIGVGVGFGLQKLASNYVSGFVILTERSVRMGDTVRVDNFEGEVTQINARYSVVRAKTGRESIIPNEMLTIGRVENLTRADPNVAQTTQVVVVHGVDVPTMLALLKDAALTHERVLRQPEPVPSLSAFAPDGLEFTLEYWLNDPDTGLLNLKSLVNQSILTGLQARGIEIVLRPRVG